MFYKTRILWKTCNKSVLLITVKMKMKMKDRWHRCDINSLRPRRGLKYKYKKCLSMLMLIWIKQHLSNIWSSIYEKIKEHWSWVEKLACLKKACIWIRFDLHICNGMFFLSTLSMYLFIWLLIKVLLVIFVFNSINCIWRSWSFSTFRNFSGFFFC